jgi:hypothetical protein
LLRGELQNRRIGDSYHKKIDGRNLLSALRQQEFINPEKEALNKKVIENYIWNF